MLEGLRQAITELLPLLVKASYAVKIIQGKMLGDAVVQPTQKALENLFSNALTDADLAVQTYIGLFLLGSYENVSFAGEEDPSQDHVSHYFPRKTEFAVALDPIDGTLYFKDGLPCFDIIVTFLHLGSIVAVVMYQPHEDQALIGINGKGLYRMSRQKIIGDQVWPKFPLLKLRSKIIVTDPHLPPHEKEIIRKHGFEPVSYTEYVADKPWLAVQRFIFTGGVAGFVRHEDKKHKKEVQCIDVGAISFLAHLARAWRVADAIDPTDELRGYHRLACLHPDAMKTPGGKGLMEELFTR